MKGIPVTYSWVAVSKGVVYTHVFEIPAHMGFKESFDFLVAELGVYEDGSKV